jgi:hypothetical protein
MRLKVFSTHKPKNAMSSLQDRSCNWSKRSKSVGNRGNGERDVDWRKTEECGGSARQHAGRIKGLDQSESERMKLEEGMDEWRKEGVIHTAAAGGLMCSNSC